MADVVESLKLLFDRPSEPLITPKGDKQAVFQLTEQFLVSLVFHTITPLFRRGIGRPAWRTTVKINLLYLLTKIFQTPEYASNGIELNDRYGDDASEKIPLKNLGRVPDFRVARQLPKDADFSLFLPRHQEMATEVIDALMSEFFKLTNICIFFH